jgi:hypothetical protein
VTIVEAFSLPEQARCFHRTVIGAGAGGLLTILRHICRLYTLRAYSQSKFVLPTCWSSDVRSSAWSCFTTSSGAAASGKSRSLQAHLLPSVPHALPLIAMA